MKKNTHARTKKKRKLLKLKAFFKKVFEKRNLKRLAAYKPHGKTITGRAIDHAVLDRSLPIEKRKYNQRQKRKLERQVPQRRK